MPGTSSISSIQNPSIGGQSSPLSSPSEIEISAPLAVETGESIDFTFATLNSRLKTYKKIKADDHRALINTIAQQVETKILKEFKKNRRYTSDDYPCNCHYLKILNDTIKQLKETMEEKKEHEKQINNEARIFIIKNLRIIIEELHDKIMDAQTTCKMHISGPKSEIQAIKSLLLKIAPYVNSLGFVRNMVDQYLEKYKGAPEELIEGEARDEVLAFSNFCGIELLDILNKFLPKYNAPNSALYFLMEISQSHNYLIGPMDKCDLKWDSTKSKLSNIKLCGPFKITTDCEYMYNSKTLNILIRFSKESESIFIFRTLIYKPKITDQYTFLLYAFSDINDLMHSIFLLPFYSFDEHEPSAPNRQESLQTILGHLFTEASKIVVLP